MQFQSGTKRARTQQTTGQQFDKRPSFAQSLPTSLLLHLMRFLNEFQSLCRVAAVCRNWNNLTTNQLDFCWHALFLYAWGPESSTLACVLVNGAPTTPWKERFRQRLRLEQNWMHRRMNQLGHVNVANTRCEI